MTAPKISLAFLCTLTKNESVWECNQKQFQAIILDGKSHNLIAKTRVHRRSAVARELEIQPVNWCSSFHAWISTEKWYVES